MTEDDRHQRVFFALWPDADLRASIHKLVQDVSGVSEGRPMTQRNLHITLAFIGVVDLATRLCLEQAADRLSVPGFELSLKRLGYWSRSKIIWLGPAEMPEALQYLADALNQALKPCGYCPESRPFHPHVTLLRKTKRAIRQKEIPPLSWRVDRFVLLESCRTHHGAAYQVLREWALRPPPASRAKRTLTP